MSSWHTKEWKEMRSRLIGDRCEQCGSTEGPMVLQHHWHPPTFKQVLHEAACVLGKLEWMKEVHDKATEMHKANQERYMSGQDTSTWCTKCAYLKDKHNMILCYECREHYHKDHLQRCRYCEEKRQHVGDLFDGMKI